MVSSEISKEILIYTLSTSAYKLVVKYGDTNTTGCSGKDEDYT